MTDGLSVLSKKRLFIEIWLDLLKIVFTILPSRVPRVTLLCTRRAQNVNADKFRKIKANERINSERYYKCV